MKKIYSLIIAILISSQLFAQAPNKMSYQAVIRNSSNNLVVSKSIGMQVSILQGSVTGTAVYVERQNPTTNANGLATIEIGTGTIISGSFSTINWGNGPYFIKTETDINGGTTYTISGTSELMSVPYALHAKTADKVTGSIIETDPIFKSSVAKSIISNDTSRWNSKLSSYSETDPIYNASIAKGINSSDTIKWNNKLSSYSENQGLSSVLSFNNNANNTKIINLGDPVNVKDAVNKNYLDSQILLLKNYINTLPFSDIDGNTYLPLKICNQIWTRTNLNVSRYRNGDEIPQVTDSATWANLTTGAWCYYNNNPANEAIYGKIYNWYAVNDSRGLAPIGWHIPSNAEWNTLSTCLGGDTVAGGKLKDKGTSRWLSPNTSATNSSNFKGLPGGCRNSNGSFSGISGWAYWWSSTEGNSTGAWQRDVNYNSANLFKSIYNKKDGYSIRCIKD
jgi:uncharacterized protein (TIGR02145 family)